MRHRLLRLAATAASVALLALSAAPATLPATHRALAADRGLVIVAQTRYDALPDEGRIKVTVDAEATSYTPNSGDTIYYYAAAVLTVQPGITDPAAISGTHTLRTSVVKSTADYTALRIAFAHNLFYQQSYSFQVTFDLPDPGGLPNRNLRIGKSIVAFPVWAFGSAGEAGGSVSVVLPSGFTPSIQGDPMTQSSGPAGEVVMSAPSIPDPSSFFAYLSADRPGAFDTTSFSVPMGAESASVLLRAWEDDPEWGARLQELMSEGLPTLRELIGLEWPVDGQLQVEEAAMSRLGDYAGIYTSATQTIRVRYDADGVVALHEGAHIWFNGNLFRDRWLLEAWAEFYGVQAATAVEADGMGYDLTDALLPYEIPLNDWGALGTVDPNIESYAYAASYHVANLIFGRTDLAGLRPVWRAAADDEMAYQPATPNGAAETAGPAPVEGWQELLDLLEERTDGTYSDLWLEWVVSENQASLLTERTDARIEYDAVEKEAGSWDLPRDLRLAMGAWQFETATADLDLATGVLDERDAIAADAARLDLTPPHALQQAFEGGGGLDAAKDEADQELALLDAIGSADARLDEPLKPLEVIGLLGDDTTDDLDAAREAFEGGQIQEGSVAVERVIAARDGAEGAGLVRSAVGGGAVLVIGGGAFVLARFRRKATVPTD